MIRLENVTKYYNSIKVLDNIDLEFKQGEVVAIIGPSGSGKSTLLRCINFLEQPTDGKIFIDQIELNLKTANQLRKKVGMVFQSFNLFPHMSVLENLMFSPIQVLKKSKKHCTDKAKELLEKVGLADKINSMPNSLSGGQKQRVAIARALAMEPEVILFDEATSALDPEMVKEVLEVIRSLAHTGITIIMVTHEMGFARELADRIIFLDHGKVIEDSTPVKFFKTPKTDRAKLFLEKIL
jgi:arginine/lysine/histidine transport system ATP-binding protein